MSEAQSDHHAEEHAAPAVSEQIRALYAKVMDQFKEMSEMAEAPPESLEKRNTSVSQWSVLQHLDHMATAAKGMLTAIIMTINSPKPNTDGEPKFLGRVVLWTGFIPRGKGKAPDAVLPKSKNAEETKQNIQMVRGFLTQLESKLDKVESSQGKAPHPMLGSFTPAQWLRFIDIHTHHHFKIIRDIRKS
ncbi:DinB family protein [Candidatus Sumerlaeota bacterium]|nr:DinB family protein [Candidatus Sumerlaeota bacterium]MBI3736979.1 DinB family protein [Candidatus Sumerlaeota bacterium]